MMHCGRRGDIFALSFIYFLYLLPFRMKESVVTDLGRVDWLSIKLASSHAQTRRPGYVNGISLMLSQKWNWIKLKYLKENKKKNKITTDDVINRFYRQLPAVIHFDLHVGSRDPQHLHAILFLLPPPHLFFIRNELKVNNGFNSYKNVFFLRFVGSIV